VPESALVSHDGQRQCHCGTWVQRTPDGTVADGMARHLLVVHAGEEVPSGG